MFKREIKPFEKHIYLSSPTMHGEELEYMLKAYKTNWMSTVGENINEVEKLDAINAGKKYAVGLCNCTSALHLCVDPSARVIGKEKALPVKALHCLVIWSISSLYFAKKFS